MDDEHVADGLNRVALGVLQHSRASMATWPCGSQSTANMSAAGAAMVRWTSMRSLMDPDRVSERPRRDELVWVKRSIGKLVDEAGENLGQRGCGRHDA